jgi:uncharacterized protein YdeI (BOF family)
MALCHEETAQQTASEEPGFTGTYPGAVKQSVSTALNTASPHRVSVHSLLRKEFQPGILQFVTQKVHSPS